jgi:hypothetical protein
MPVYLDEVTTDETNPHIINFAVFSDTPLLTPAHTGTFKLKPIHIAFNDFEKLFFKRRRTIYTVAKLCFLNELFNKIKPKLSRMLQDMYCVSNKASILLNRELFDMVLESRIKSRVALTHTNFVKAIDSTNDTYVRITLSLGIVAISSAVTIEFIFKMRNLPPCELFDADDLLNSNTLDLFQGAIHCDANDVCCDISGNVPVIVDECCYQQGECKEELVVDDCECLLDEDIGVDDCE